MVRDQFNLKGKKGIITGASKGIGRGMSEGLAQMGADLVIAARTREALEQAARELRIHGGKIVPVQTDVSRDEDVKLLVETACAEFGDIDFAFCNAGIVRRAPSHEHSLDDFDEVYRVNVRSVFLLAQFTARVMMEHNHGGSIIITDSGVSVHGSRNVPAYTSSKGAVHSMIRTLANDWGPYGIRVNGIGPGFSETDMTEGIRTSPERYQYLTSRMALKRWGKPEDFAGVAVFLASDASSYVTGTTIFVDGGFLGM